MRAAVTAYGVAGIVLACLTVYVVTTVKIQTDISFFLPSDRTVETQALVEGLDRNGTLMIVRLGGVEPEAVSVASDSIVGALRDVPGFAAVRNGRPHMPASIETYLIDNRYLLGPAPADDHFEIGPLRARIDRSIERLATSTGWAFREMFPRDPTGRLNDLLDELNQTGLPDRPHGVWLDEEGRALILAHLSAPSSDLAAQARARTTLSGAVESARETAPELSVESSGPGLFALRASEKIRSDMQWLSAMAGIAVAALLFVVFRRFHLVVLAGLPLALGLLAGIALTQALFGSVHGVAVTFGAVLSGVAADYPIHLFGHRRAGEGARRTARRIAVPMLIGAGTTVAGLLALTQSSFPGLAQIGVLSSMGIVTAVLVSRHLLPRLIPAGEIASGESAAAGLTVWQWRALRDRPAVRKGLAGAMAMLFVAASAVAIFQPQPVWESDLSALSVSDPAARKLDGELRAALGLPDVRRVVLIEGDDPQAVLVQQNATAVALDASVEAGRLGGYAVGAAFLPPVAEQRRRQNLMPDAAELRRRLVEATRNGPVDISALKPFVADIERQRMAAAISPDGLAASPVGHLVPRPWPVQDHWAGIIALTPPVDLNAEAVFPARVIDLGDVASGIVTDYRNEAALLLLVGLAVGLGVLVAGLRDVGRVARAAAPPVGAVLITAAVLLAAGVSLNLFHLLALLLVASVGVDYALFFPDYSASEQDGANGFRSVELCCTTSVVVFAILASSSIPVLGAIGVTVAIGAVLSFILTICLAGGAERR